MPLNHAALVRKLACLAPGSVAVRTSAGECARGILSVVDVDRQEETGLSLVAGTVTLRLPVDALPNTEAEGEIAITEDGRTARYIVRDILRIGDGREKRYVLVPA